MGSSENFCLRWNDFSANISSAFRDLRSDSDLFDVTLACCAPETGAKKVEKIGAHKVILSACSPIFKQIVANQSGNANPVIYLRGVRAADLEAVLDFMYYGEVSLAQDDLNSFLSVAEDFQVKGLTQNDNNSRGRNSGSYSASQPPPFKKVKNELKDPESEKPIEIDLEPKVSSRPSTSNVRPQPVVYQENFEADGDEIEGHEADFYEEDHFEQDDDDGSGQGKGN